ncbi:hypothetical protein SOV_43030 [Sporomusa ovata DSM 2662]|uniref:Uncharacterized protein n=1 Tax=Sporomusa ovata TaxID=2378 RepID=A0A0U1KVS9_9FIRM|nr:hypothetical protein [Sporomusa ovata]EQB26691.1 hypothetical protein SOV_3c05650 [Sporomusa ovata DSM 2662]CQR70784.1 hypothetical protein SpAn4DRAFT_1762 [Sporomusa ovata]
MAKNNANDSLAQKKAKEQNQNRQTTSGSGDKHLNGPNHPAT